MRLVCLFVLFTSICGTYLERFGADPCTTLAGSLSSRIISSCDLDSEICVDLFWGSNARLTVKYSTEGNKLLSLKCSEAESMNVKSSLGKRKLRSYSRLGFDQEAESLQVVSSSSSSVETQYIPDWYNADVSKSKNVEHGFESVLARLHSEISPLLEEFPLVRFGERANEAAASILLDMKFIETTLSPEDDDMKFESIAAAWGKDARWIDNRKLVFFWLIEASVSHFDEGQYLESFAPFLHLHMTFRKTVYDRTGSNIIFRLSPIVEVMEKFYGKEGSLPILYRMPLPGHLNADAVIDLFASDLLPRASLVWYQYQRNEQIPPQLVRDSSILAQLEAFVSYEVLNQGAETTLQTFLCASLVQVCNFVAWFWSNDERRSSRLIFSSVNLCYSRTSMKVRREIMHVFLHYIPSAARPLSNIELDLPSNPSALIQASRNLLEKFIPFRFRDVIIEFTDTQAMGHVGPRAHWLGILFSEYFKPGTGLFEYSDDTKVFLKPVSSFSVESMTAVGKLIGLGVKYGLTIGARLTPCLLAVLRSPRKGVSHLEECVKRQDSAFVNSLNKIPDLFAWEDQEAAGVILSDFVSDGVPLTPESFPAFKQKKLYEKGIGVMKDAIFSIKAGIEEILPNGALELFTEEEFEKMVNGLTHLSAPTLWAGITFRRLAEGSRIPEWLNEIIQEQSEEFRFAFNRFVTGVPQPPASRDMPWIVVDVEAALSPNSLPLAHTCFSNLQLPTYSSKSALQRKLLLAVFEGTETLELF